MLDLIAFNYCANNMKMDINGEIMVLYVNIKKGEARGWMGQIGDVLEHSNETETAELP